MSSRRGRPFLQIPGPTNVPDRVLRAMAAPTIDHRGPEFRALARQLLADVRRPCGTTGPVAMYPSSGTGAWEAALVNTLSPGDAILAFETGHFATLWCQMARRLGHEPTTAELADFDPEALAGIFSERPALHRYPKAMAARVQDVARLIVEQYDGEPDRLWTTAKTGDELLKRVSALPGFRTYKQELKAAAKAAQAPSS